MRKKNESKSEEDGSQEEGGGTENGNQDLNEEGRLLTEKEKLLELYQTLKDLGINSIGDLEVKISRL